MQSECDVIRLIITRMKPRFQFGIHIVISTYCDFVVVVVQVIHLLKTKRYMPREHKYKCQSIKLISDEGNI